MKSGLLLLLQGISLACLSVTLFVVEFVGYGISVLDPRSAAYKVELLFRLVCGIVTISTGWTAARTRTHFYHHLCHAAFSRFFCFCLLKRKVVHCCCCRICWSVSHTEYLSSEPSVKQVHDFGSCCVVCTLGRLHVHSWLEHGERGKGRC